MSTSSPSKYSNLHPTMWGEFSKPEYLGAGVDPAKKGTRPYAGVEARYKGKQFTTPKKNDSLLGTFTRDFKPLFDGCKYDEREQSLLSSFRNSKLADNKAPFRPSSPPKSNTGMGSWYGCIGNMPKYESPIRPGKSANPNAGLKPFLAGTVKDGQKSPYMSDPYVDYRPNHETTKFGPFYSRTRAVGIFDAYPSTGAPKVYTEDNKRPASASKSRASMTSTPSRTGSPWVPSSPCGRKDFNPVTYASRPSPRGPSARPQSAPVFRPTSPPLSRPTPSIIMYPRTRGVYAGVDAPSGL